MADRDTADRTDRLIAAVEAQTNAIGRLVQTLEATHEKSTRAAVGRLQRAVLDKPIVVTPMVEAAVKRALARIKK